MKKSNITIIISAALLAATIEYNEAQHDTAKLKLLQEIEVLNKEVAQQVERNHIKDLTIASSARQKKELEIRLSKSNSEIQRLEKKLKPTKPTRGSSKTLIGTFEATAYTDNIESQGKWIGQTASGMKPQVGVVAVDPKIIPLGTKLYIEGYGDCIAGDTGGAIKGYRIDLFKNTSKECREWGRRKVKVYKRD